MSVYKPSNAYPALEEVDLTTHNTFTLQNNTSGETAKACKLTILNERGDETIYEGEIQTLSPAVKNKGTIKVSFYVPGGEPFYADSALEKNEGILLGDTECWYISEKTSFVLVNGEKKYVKTPSTFLGKYSNGKNYQWGARVYNALPNSTAQPNTLVCEGYLVGSTKYVIWSRIPHEIEITDDMSGAKKVEAEKLNQQYKTAKDQIKYDRYIEFTDIPPTELILGAKDDEDATLPSTNYTERQKIDWSTVDMGTDEDIVKIETTEDFKYNYKDGTEYHIYKCSDEHTVNSFFADPNSNINVANFVVIYNSAEDALASFKARETPGTGTYTIAPKFNSRKIVGYSSDTGEVRVHDAFSEAPQNGQAYRIFSQDVSTKLYTELFSSDIVFEVPSSTQYYGTIIQASTSSPVIYYSDTSLTKQAGQITMNASCEFVTPSYSTLKVGTSVYYVATPAGGATQKAYTTVKVNQNVGYIVINETTFAVPFDSLKAKIGDASTNNIFKAQVVGGTPINDSFYKVLSNRWDQEGVEGAVKRLFIQPNINIKTDVTNPNELVFESNGCRININKVTRVNPTTGKTIDVTFNKLDNTQWMLEGDAITYGSDDSIIPFVGGDSEKRIIQPQLDYKVYTDFMDSMPYNLYYGRSTPVIKIYYWDINTEEYIEFTGEYSASNIYYPYRDLSFRVGIFADEEGAPAQQAIKYVHYDLYYNGKSTDSASYITSSDDIYESDGDWKYRGFMTKTDGMYYTLKVSITDEYNFVFTKEITFGIQYEIDTTVETPISVDFDCNDKSFLVSMLTPVVAETTQYGSFLSVTDADIEKGVVKIGKNQVLNYIKTQQGDILNIPNNFNFLTRFQITGDFLITVPAASEKEIFAIGYRDEEDSIQKNGTFSLCLHSGINFYWSDEEQQFVVDPNAFRIFLYKDGVKQTGCFNGKDYFDIAAQVKNLYVSQGFKYSLVGDTKYVLVDKFTAQADSTKMYILQNADSGGCRYHQIWYDNGVYSVDMSSGVAVYTLSKVWEYVFVDRLDQIPQEYQKDFTTDATKYLDSDNKLQYVEDNTYWVDGEYLLTGINKKIFDQLWFVLYLVYKDGSLKCTLEIEQ